MSKEAFLAHLTTQLEEMDRQALLKTEKVIATPQDMAIKTQDNIEMINFCANNYLGLSNHPVLIKAAKEALDNFGLGMSSVRFICGTQRPHLQLEQAMAEFSGTEDCILYSSCFDANGGLFETLLTKEDAVVSDALNHASIIDGIRLCKAHRYRYKNNDMIDLRAQCQLAREQGARHLLIATDGVFSMDGIVANLPEIIHIAEEFGAIVMIDDCHATGFLGENGRGTAEYCGVFGKVDIITGTFGKALGGASGGYVCANKHVVDLLRQRSRPYLFSNALAPSLTVAGLKALEYIKSNPSLITQISNNTKQMRAGLTEIGYNIIPGEHPIIPIMLGDALLAKEISTALLARGIFAVQFCYPVVPQGKARIRLQMSAAHTQQQIEKSLEIFNDIARMFNINNH